MLEEMVLAGFGGQGVMVAGKLLAQAGMDEGKQVVWIPAYGPEMRGGTANCTVIISDEEIGSPMVARPMLAVAFNRPSLDKYEPLVKPGGYLVINSSISGRSATRTDITAVEIPANEMAEELGNARIVNSIMLGALIGCTDIVAIDSLVEAMRSVFSARQHHLLEVNRSAMLAGEARAREAVAAKV